MLDSMVARDLGHDQGKELTEAETWEAISANAAAGIAACELAIMAKESTK